MFVFVLSQVLRRCFACVCLLNYTEPPQHMVRALILLLLFYRSNVNTLSLSFDIHLGFRLVPLIGGSRRGLSGPKRHSSLTFCARGLRSPRCSHLSSRTFCKADRPFNMFRLAGLRQHLPACELYSIGLKE